MQEMMKDLSKKENVLKQSVYFAALSDEAIAEINNAMGITMQSFAMEVNTIAVEGNKEIEKNKLENDEEAIKETNQKLQLAFQEKTKKFRN